MRWVGEGSGLWRVRVDLFAKDESPTRGKAAHDALLRQLISGDGKPGVGVGADLGSGIEGRPVVGLSFWVRADDVGQAANSAVEAARRAGIESGAGSELYDVVVVPDTAVVMPGDPSYPPMPD